MHLFLVAIISHFVIISLSLFKSFTFRTVARNLLRETKERVWGTEVSQRGPGAEPRWETGGKSPRSRRQMVISSYDGATCTHAPCLRHCYYVIVNDFNLCQSCCTGCLDKTDWRCSQSALCLGSRNTRSRRGIAEWKSIICTLI